MKTTRHTFRFISILLILVLSATGCKTPVEETSTRTPIDDHPPKDPADAPPPPADSPCEYFFESADLKNIRTHEIDKVCLVEKSVDIDAMTFNEVELVFSKDTKKDHLVMHNGDCSAILVGLPVLNELLEKNVETETSNSSDPQDRGFIRPAFGPVRIVYSVGSLLAGAIVAQHAADRHSAQNERIRRAERDLERQRNQTRRAIDEKIAVVEKDRNTDHFDVHYYEHLRDMRRGYD